MIRKKLQSILADKGFALTLLFSITVLIYFYGGIVRHANHTYFVTGGDGLQAYYGAVYHVNHDPELWRTQGMNYPYGEEVFFTGCQPLVVNMIKMVSHVVNIAPYTIGVLNMIMLLSIVLSALVLYLIFRRFRLPYFYSALAATAIAFLSPQIERLSGHFTLTYQFAIPLFLYGLIRFYEEPSFRKSIWIGIFVFLMAATHMYFLGFMGMLSIFYWTILYFKKHGDFSKIIFCAKHFFIQLVIPFLFLQVIVMLLNTANDRTAFPWGFMEFKSGWDGVLFPFGKPYMNKYTYLYNKTENLEWEGQAYIGIVAVVVFLALFIHAIFNLIKLSLGNTNVKSAIKHPLLGLFFWSSFFILIYSFATPFEGSREWLIRYIGPLKQMRGIGRFNWIFYYVINIIAVVQIYEWTKSKKVLNYILCGFTLYMLCYDGRYLNRPMHDHLENKIPELDDQQNNLPEDQWLKKINVADYQAIIALPYFHVGSENIWLEPQSKIISSCFIYSLKTGLPTTNAILSRLSLSQTYKNVMMVKEPYRPLEFLNDIKSRKPFLVLVSEDELNNDEKRFLLLCSKKMDTPGFSVYELPFEKLNHLSDQLYTDAIETSKTSNLFMYGDFQSTDSLKTFVYNGYEDNQNKESYKGKGCFEGNINKYNVIFNDTIPNAKEGDYFVSFWMNDFSTDLFPRTIIETACLNDVGNVINSANYSTCAKSFRFIENGRALIEVKIPFPKGTVKAIVTLWNTDMLDKNAMLRIDELLVRPTGSSVYGSIDAKSITVNNRTYYAR